MPKFSLKIFNIQNFCCFSTQLVNKLHQLSLPEALENILPSVNTKQSLRDDWLEIFCTQFHYILIKIELYIFSKIPTTFLLVSQQPNISQMLFCIQHKLEDILNHLTYRSLLLLFYELSNKATKMQYFEHFKKCPNFKHTVHTLDCT